MWPLIVFEKHLLSVDRVESVSYARIGQRNERRRGSFDSFQMLTLYKHVSVFEQTTGLPK